MNFSSARAVLPALIVLSLAALAEAGVISSATGPIRVNGQEVVLQPGQTLELKAGDRVDTGASVAVFQSASGDRVTLEKGTKARADGLTDGVDYLFVESGSAYGTIGDKTSFGGTAGWATAPEGQTAKAFLDVPRDRPGSEGSFRAVEGGVWVRYNSYRVWLPQRNSITLAVDPARPDVFAFRTSQQNDADVDVVRTVAGGDIFAHVPKATVGRMMSAEPNKTRIENDITSLKTGKIRLETRYPGRPEQNAALGPGTYALIDNATGAIEVSFTPVEFVILERAISLTNEFATLSQSNFSDLGVGSGPGRR